MDVLFERLVQFVRQELNVEDQRHIAEQLSEEELAIFDLLIQPDMALSEKDKAEVKKVVQELLETLKREKLVLDWRKKQQAQAAVKKTVRDMFYYALPPSVVEPHYAVKREGVVEKTSIHWHTVAYANTDRANGRVETILPERDVFRKRPKSTGQHQHS